MIDPSDYIEETFDELEVYVRDMESDIEALVNEFLSDFHIDDRTLTTDARNYELANRSDSVFDDAYDTFILAFLAFLANKILTGAMVVIADLASRGISRIGDETELVGKMIGYVDGKIVKGGYLYNLGRMSILRERFHNYIVKAVASGQRLNKFLRDSKSIFVSSDKRSAFSVYYMRYAYDSVAQVMNSIALYIADARGLDKFEYHGGLVKDSRPFCVEHASNVYTREDAKQFDTMDWKGKIPDVPFLIAVGGYNCQHSIKWLEK